MNDEISWEELEERFKLPTRVLNETVMITLTPELLDKENWTLLKHMFEITDDVSMIRLKVNEIEYVPNKNKEG